MRSWRFSADERQERLHRPDVACGPLQLHVGDDAELGEPRVVVRVHQLQVRDGVTAVAVAVGLARDLVPVEGGTDGAVADGVRVHLPTAASNTWVNLPRVSASK